MSSGPRTGRDPPPGRGHLRCPSRRVHRGRGRRGRQDARAVDPEVSEAIDFIRYYALNSLELDSLDGAKFTPDEMVVITPPWNFPVAIPTGGTVAALAAGSAVIHKPSKPTPHCSALIVDCLWQAGVPKDVLQLCAPIERDLGQHLVSHPDVDRVILTGASETAALFKSFRLELHVNAETSGKNALIVTPAADRDLAMADLVHSAFGHAGQKCSAASLGIMVGSTYDSERYRTTSSSMPRPRWSSIGRRTSRPPWAR